MSGATPRDVLEEEVEAVRLADELGRTTTHPPDAWLNPVIVAMWAGLSADDIRTLQSHGLATTPGGLVGALDKLFLQGDPPEPM